MTRSSKMKTDEQLSEKIERKIASKRKTNWLKSLRSEPDYGFFLSTFNPRQKGALHHG